MPHYAKLMFNMRRALLAAPALMLFWMAGSSHSQPAPELKWYKGNLHTHTLNSDGDSTPLDVATWYRENGYHFLVLSDHNYLTEIGELNRVLGARDKFLLIAGEEVSDSFGGKPVHLGAYDLSERVAPAGGSSVGDTIARNVAAIKATGALPALNHPNFRWAVTAEDILRAPDLTHLEIYNGHPRVHNRGGGGTQSLDEIWDALLTAGRRVYGIAVDDAHHFKRFGRTFSNPGRGWIAVRAAALDTPSIMAALRRGDFYASTGVELNGLDVTSGEIRLDIKPVSDTRFTTLFIGAGGEVLERSTQIAPVYRFRGNERYVRARVEASNGDIAWTQPVFR